MHDDLIRDLGTASDAEVAKKHKVPHATVRALRVERGIPAFHRGGRWTPERVALLGKVSDMELHRMWGIAVSSIRTYRESLGIPKADVPRRAPEPKTFGESLVHHQERLGYTDVQMGAALDVGESMYRSWRNDDPKRVPLAVAQEGALARLRKLQPPAKGT